MILRHSVITLSSAARPGTVSVPRVSDLTWPVASFLAKPAIPVQNSMLLCTMVTCTENSAAETHERERERQRD